MRPPPHRKTAGRESVFDDPRPRDLNAPPHGSLCEWEGRARYYAVAVGSRRLADVAWFYPDAMRASTALRGHAAVPGPFMSGAGALGC
jgi:uncharacterized protein (DUF427 family)